MEQEYYTKLEVQEEIHQNYISSVDTSTGIIANMLTIISIFLTVFGLILGFFIQDLYKKIIKTKEEIQVVDDFIKDKSIEFYSKIKQEELKHILEKLKKTPENFSHFFGFFTSFKIEGEENFLNLKTINNEIYKHFTNASQLDIEGKLINSPYETRVNGLRQNYYESLLTLFQNFPVKTVTDNTLWDRLSKDDFFVLHTWIIYESEKTEIFKTLKSEKSINIQDKITQIEKFLTD